MSNSHKVVMFGGRLDKNPPLESVIEQMPYLMVETADYGIEFITTQAYQPEEHWTVLRLHAFGDGGDLLIRRDEERIFWRFVGKENVLSMLDLSGGEEYPDSLYYSDDDEHDENVLLWGEYDTDRQHWYENRVGKAKLNYPKASSTWNRVQIRARRVIDDYGKTVAYWTYTLTEHAEQEQT